MGLVLVGDYVCNGLVLDDVHNTIVLARFSSLGEDAWEGRISCVCVCPFGLERLYTWKTAKKACEPQCSLPGFPLPQVLSNLPERNPSFLLYGKQLTHLDTYSNVFTSPPK